MGKDRLLNVKALRNPFWVLLDYNFLEAKLRERERRVRNIYKVEKLKNEQYLKECESLFEEKRHNNKREKYRKATDKIINHFEKQ